MDQKNDQPPVSPVYEQLATWNIFYHVVFNRGQRMCSSIAPPHCSGFNQLILLLRGISAYDLVRESQARFLIEIPPDVLAEIKSGIPTERRRPDDYAVWIRGGVEPEKRPVAVRRLLFSHLPFDRQSRMTLSERLVFGLFHYWKHKEHVDQQGATLCLATQDKSGRIPEVTHTVAKKIVGRIRKKEVDIETVFISPWKPDSTDEIPEYLGLREVKY